MILPIREHVHMKLRPAGPIPDGFAFPPRELSFSIRSEYRSGAAGRGFVTFLGPRIIGEFLRRPRRRDRGGTDGCAARERAAFDGGAGRC
jgi:hypothetical protein